MQNCILREHKTRTKIETTDFLDFYRLFYPFSWAIYFWVIHFIRPLKSKFCWLPLAKSHFIQNHWSPPSYDVAYVTHSLPSLLTHVLFQPHQVIALWGLLLKSKDEIKTRFKQKKQHEFDFKSRCFLKRKSFFKFWKNFCL